MKKLHSNFFISFSLAFVYCVTCNKPILFVSNNGPAILGSNVTFSASLINYHAEDKLKYIFSDGVVEVTIKSGLNVSFTRCFDDDFYSENSYNMTVTVIKDDFFFGKVIASNYTSFILKDYIVGRIVLLNRNDELKDKDEVGVGDNVTMFAELHDPSGFFHNVEIDYEWSIDMERHRSNGPEFSYIYSQARTSSIFLRLSAKCQDGFKKGFFYKELTVKVPVNSMDVSGNPFIHHGEILYLNISCNGTPPFEYCSELLDKNETEDNITCSQLVFSTSCLFFIKRYFHTSGTYHIGIYVSNDVKVVKRNIEVIVYTVSTKPLLSTVIIPIVCSLLTLVIISGGIAYHIHQRKQQAIEVANFDFLEESDAYVEKTLFEKIFDSFTCRTCIFKHSSSEGSDYSKDETDPLLDNQIPERSTEVT